MVASLLNIKLSIFYYYPSNKRKMTISEAKVEKFHSPPTKKRKKSGVLQIQISNKKDLLEELPLLHTTKSRSQQKVYPTPSIYTTMHDSKSPASKYFKATHLPSMYTYYTYT